ncbi:DNA mismatch repair protein MutT [Paenibacillus polymyxa]|uniref:8-oxo-dGTP diphosphatase n=1 Tax=Paenibacillus jamilae TaxID=114136 RepID=UPI0007AB766C|nr:MULTISPECIES: 8-oxo-dGTP diphosphatase [Paenibacillus]KZE73311.1 DNA mismatch repair protein MutT [Paenibacillus jamilae]OBA08303.1 DNA mismatch repair protein MutT [Paenibacillus polymyxa]
MIRLAMEVEHKIYTMCMIQDGTKVLLMNRPNRKGFPGYIAPGGKVEFPESIVNGAIREVKEETGLTVTEIVFKGIDEYCDPNQGLRYMVFNYLATATEGELLKNPPEGDLLWVDMKEALNLPMQDWFKRRFPLFFEPGTFEVSSVWLAETDETLEATTKNYGV